MHELSAIKNLQMQFDENFARLDLMQNEFPLPWSFSVSGLVENCGNTNFCATQEF